MRPLIEVDAGAITENIERLRTLSGLDVIGVVKANGYGHGMEIAAHAMLDGGAVQLGVAEISEALRLRAAGIRVPLLAWLHCSNPDFAAAQAAGIEVGISSLVQLEAAAAVGGVRVHLKFDTGLGRNGVPAADWAAVIDRAAQLQADGAIRVVGVMSHLAGTSDDADDIQRERFFVVTAATADLEPESTHLCASGGLLGTVVGTRARPGISAYGLHPNGADAAGDDARGLGIRPALRLSAPVESGRLAFGWRHGLLPAQEAAVLVDGRRVRIAEPGREISKLAEPVTGTAVLIGSGTDGEPTAGEWAGWTGTIGYEVVTRLAADIERRRR